MLSTLSRYIGVLSNGCMPLICFFLKTIFETVGSHFKFRKEKHRPPPPAPPFVTNASLSVYIPKLFIKKVDFVSKLFNLAFK